MQQAAAQSWLDLQCSLIPGVSHGVLTLHAEPGAGGTPLTARWPAGDPLPDALDRAAQDAFVQGSALVRNEAGRGGATVIACPLRRDGRMLGSVAVTVDDLPGQQTGSVAQILGWGSAWLNLLLDTRGAAPSAADAVLSVCRVALDAGELRSAAVAAVNRTARLLGCERAAIGLRRGHRVEALALADAVEFDPRSSLVRELEEQMTLALHAGDTPAAGSGGTLRHVLVLPARAGTLGALYLERVSGRPFDADESALAAAVADSLGPVLETLQRESRGTLARIADAVPGLVCARRALLLVTLLGAVTALCLASGDYRVSAPAVIEGAVQRSLVAPIDGYIREARARAGDVLDAGDVVAVLDDEPLQLERRRWQGEYAELLGQQQRAVAELDRASASVLKAQVAKAAAQVALLDQQLARTRILAPFHGVVVSGDLSQSLGAPVERGQVLFEMAPLDSYRVVLRVAEADIGNLVAGQTGEIAVSGLAGETLPLVIERIAGAADSEAGSHAFRVEARLLSDSVHLLPGLRGVAKVSVDERPLVWIWSHGLIQKVRAWLWQWLP